MAESGGDIQRMVVDDAPKPQRVVVEGWRTGCDMAQPCGNRTVIVARREARREAMRLLGGWAAWIAQESPLAPTGHATPGSAGPAAQQAAMTVELAMRRIGMREVVWPWLRHSLVLGRSAAAYAGDVTAAMAAERQLMEELERVCEEDAAAPAETGRRRLGPGRYVWREGDWHRLASGESPPVGKRVMTISFEL